MAAFRTSPRSSSSRLTLLPALAGGLAGMLGLVTIALVPVESLEHVVWASGIATLLPAAQPPLGTTARMLVALGLGATAAALCWACFYLLVGPGGIVDPRRKRDRGQPGGVPVIRRADAHPDAPPRAPMLAADLGTPLMEIVAPAEQPLPDDLDQPLAAFDPYALLAHPFEQAHPVAPLVRQPRESEPSPSAAPAATTDAAAQPDGPVAPIDQAAVPRPIPAPAPDGPPTIESLLNRLEQGARRREARAR